MAGEETRLVANVDPALTEIERKVDSNIPLSIEDGLALYRTPDIHNLGRIARGHKERKSGKKVFYVLNRYINSTNVCFAGCTFCSFAADEFKEPQRVFRMTRRSGLRQGHRDRARTSIRSTSSAATTRVSSRSTTGCR